MINTNDLASLIINYVGGKENIVFVFNCYTRARINVKDTSKVNQEAIKATEGVIGLVIDKTQVQVIVGPGKSVKLAQAIIVEIEGGSNEAKKEAQEKINQTKEYLETKNEVRKKTNKGITAIIRKISAIFVPIIPMFIACGILLAIYSICTQANPGFAETQFGKIFKIVSESVFTILNVIVGYNATKEFGGDGIIGAALAGILTNPLLDEIKIGALQFNHNVGGIFAVLMVAIATAYFEKLLRKFMPDVIDPFMTPLITVVVMSAIGLFAFQPLGGYINQGLSFVFKQIGLHVPALLGIVPLFYLLLVLTGIHHILMPVSIALIASDPNKLGYLMPVQLMAGAAEVGAAIAILIKSKNSKLKKTIISSLPIGVLGIDEPLIWGMSVPLKRPFISAGIGGFIGGTFVACMHVGSPVPESTGIQAAFVTNKPWMFLIGFVISIIAGFLIQLLIGFQDPVEVVDDITHEVKNEYIETSILVKKYKQYKLKHSSKDDIKVIKN